MKCLQYARHTFKNFTYIDSFDPYNNPARSILTPFYRWRDWGTEESNTFSKVTQLENSKSKKWTQEACLRTISSTTALYCCMVFIFKKKNKWGYYLHFMGDQTKTERSHTIWPRLHSFSLVEPRAKPRCVIQCFSTTLVGYYTWREAFKPLGWSQQLGELELGGLHW